MTLKYFYDGVEQTDTGTRLRGPIDSLSAHADGMTGSSKVFVRDPTGVLAYEELRTFRVVETACTAAPILSQGMIYEISVDRGEYTLGAARQWGLTVTDLNGLLHQRILHGASAKRPQETGTARAAWLMASSAMSGLVYDNGAIAVDTRLFDAADYQGKYPDEVLPDLCVTAATTGRIFFVYMDQATEQPSLFLNEPTATIKTSTLSISNVDGDADNIDDPLALVFEPSPSPTLTRSGADIYDGLYYVWKGNPIYRQRPATFAAYGIHRDATFSTDRIGTLATAETHTTAWLEAHKDPVDTISVTVKLPRSKVGLIAEGDRVAIRFGHLPGYESWTWSRVTTRTISVPLGKLQYYDVVLELSVRTFNGDGGGGSGNFPQQPSAPPSVFQTKDSATSSTLTLDSTPGPGDTFYGFIARRGGGSGFVGTGWTLLGHATGNGGVGTQPSDLYKRTVVSGDTTVGPAGGSAWWNSGGGDTAWIVEVIGAGTETTVIVDSTYPSSSFSGGSVANVAGALLLTGSAMGVADNDETKMASVGAGVTQFSNHNYFGGGNRPWLWGGYMANVAAGTHAVTGTLTSASATGYSAITVGIAPSGAGTPPRAGQWVYQETPTMSGASGTTAFPFATGSLRVYVDLTDQTGAITAQNGAAGTFTLGFTPKTGEAVTVDYQGI